jgi:hypothetical protein
LTNVIVLVYKIINLLNNISKYQGLFFMTTSMDLNQLRSLPFDLIPIIFKNLSSELDTLALVCKTWQAWIDSQTFRNMICPLRAMGIAELKKINPTIVDAGIEPLLPRRAYRDFAENGGLLFFNPGKVKVKNAEGNLSTKIYSNCKKFRRPKTDNQPFKCK